MASDLSGTWQNVLQLLKEASNEQAYKTWFEPMRLIEASDKSIVLGVPNKFFKNWVRDHYEDIIVKSFEQVVNKKVALEFVITPDEEENGGAPEAGNAVRENGAERVAEEPKKHIFPFFFKKPWPS